MTQHKPLVVEQTPTPDATEKIDRFLAADRPDPPCLVVDLDVVRTKYAALLALFPDATLYYAVNANPAAGALATLDLLGAKSDLASEGETIDLNYEPAHCGRSSAHYCNLWPGN